ncbi:acyl-CoA dehydrogenase family protein [Flexivirga meconopsidis]|uniref:acyl-CoA dehydrogenase family protein n=1 Tax=Flexivirga meconopsidis TaxID=2977121 RepID=UPI0022403A66|nr:acyl-CoA dehydrogenase family protein [Flexivirga meconopsidis]
MTSVLSPAIRFDFSGLPSSEGGFTATSWDRVRATGVLREIFPRQFGGAGHSLSEALDAFERLGHANPDAGLSFSAATAVASTGVPLESFGSDYLKHRYLPSVCDGSLVGAHAITEASSGSDALHMATRAVPHGEDFVIEGSKTFVTNAGIADYYVIYARTSDHPGPFGLTAFLVPADAPGLQVVRTLPTMGLRTSPVGELRLADLRVPRDHVIGGVGRGFLVLDHVMQREILLSFTINVGEMARRLEESVEWVRGRTQYGAPIASYQAVARRVVDMRIAVDTSRLWLRDAARRIDAGEDASAQVAIAKLTASEANLETAISATRLFGGRGYLTEFGVEQQLRDAAGGAIYSGTNDIQYNRLAALMGLR